MTRTCDTCGDELDPARDKAKGRYRDDCLPCIKASVEVTNSHVAQCDDAACIVCKDYREEFGQ